MKICTGDSSEEFHSCFLSKLTDNNLKEICFSKAEGNLLKSLYSLTLYKFSWYSLKEKMHVEFPKVAKASHASLALLSCKLPH